MHLLVTGGGRGIGAATCRLAGRRGWDVTVNYAGDAAAAEETAAAVRAAGGRAIAVRGDVTAEADTAALFDAADGRLRPALAPSSPTPASSPPPAASPTWTSTASAG